MKNNSLAVFVKMKSQVIAVHKPIFQVYFIPRSEHDSLFSILIMHPFHASIRDELF